MSIYSNRQMCESVCKKESVCAECIFQDAQNMSEVVWQLGRRHKRSSKTARRVSVRLFSRDRHPRLLSLSVTLLYKVYSFEIHLTALLSLDFF